MKKKITIMTITKTVCSADEKFDGTYPTNVVVTNEGHCTYIPPGIFKVNKADLKTLI